MYVWTEIVGGKTYRDVITDAQFQGFDLGLQDNGWEVTDVWEEMYVDVLTPATKTRRRYHYREG